MTKCTCGNTYEYICKHECPNGNSNTSHPKYKQTKGRLRKGYNLPFQSAEVKGRKYWDYSLKFGGNRIEINVEHETGALYIFTPEEE